MRSTASLSFFFHATAATEIYTLSLHDALPISRSSRRVSSSTALLRSGPEAAHATERACGRSEEHTSELQSQSNLVCRLLLEKKKPSLSRILTLAPRDTDAPYRTPPNRHSPPHP